MNIAARGTEKKKIKSLDKHHYNNIHTKQQQRSASAETLRNKRQEKEYTKGPSKTQNEVCTNLQCQGNSPRVIFEMREEEGGALAEMVY